MTCDVKNTTSKVVKAYNLKRPLKTPHSDFSSASWPVMCRCRNIWA